jgi:hypothetical protein
VNTPTGERARTQYNRILQEWRALCASHPAGSGQKRALAQVIALVNDLVDGADTARSPLAVHLLAALDAERNSPRARDSWAAAWRSYLDAQLSERRPAVTHEATLLWLGLFPNVLDLGALAARLAADVESADEQARQCAIHLLATLADRLTRVADTRRSLAAHDLDYILATSGRRALYRLEDRLVGHRYVLESEDQLEYLLTRLDASGELRRMAARLVALAAPLDTRHPRRLLEQRDRRELGAWFGVDRTNAEQELSGGDDFTLHLPWGALGSHFFTQAITRRSSDRLQTLTPAIINTGGAAQGHQDEEVEDLLLVMLGRVLTLGEARERADTHLRDLRDATGAAALLGASASRTIRETCMEILRRCPATTSGEIALIAERAAETHDSQTEAALAIALRTARPNTADAWEALMGARTIEAVGIAIGERLDLLAAVENRVRSLVGPGMTFSNSTRSVA